AIPVPQEEVSSADEAQAAKRRCLPTGSATLAETPMETTNTPACPLTTAPVAVPAAEHHSISTLPTSQPLSQPTTVPHVAPASTSGIQIEAESPMDTSVALSDALTESTLASDPMPTPQTPFTVDVSYMETLLNSHFPQDSGPTEPLY
ncbi:glucose starvation modulator protein 1-like, partial [Plectropomus leopardus]|uniref:glucose starvation modulator protein 1-like n=1 Tax=Plectropomus leopardus TaxID=160734 RepID=UPI001C4A7FB8